VGLDDLNGVPSPLAAFPGDSDILDCGGGVGSAFGGREPSANVTTGCFGEKGGVGSSGRFAEARGRGVDPLDTDTRPGVLCADSSPVRGVSEWLDLALLGAFIAAAGRWLRIVSGAI
jgi:hypothetical protein